MRQRARLVSFLMVGLFAVPLVQAQQVQPVHPPGEPWDAGQYFQAPGVTILDQQPSLGSCGYSDPTWPQILADNFVVPAGPGVEVTQLVVWVVYWTGNTPPAVNSPTVRFYSDGGIVPGSLIGEEFSVPTVRVDTGLQGSGGFDLYQLTLSLANPVALNAGTTYWVEIAEDTAVPNSRNCWEQGLLDETNGVPGSAISFTEPPVGWGGLGQEWSLQVIADVVPVELESFDIEK